MLTQFPPVHIGCDEAYFGLSYNQGHQTPVLRMAWRSLSMFPEHCFTVGSTLLVSQCVQGHNQQENKSR